MLESELKREIIKRLKLEGGWGRRLEDRFAVGLLDTILVTNRVVIYGECKILQTNATLTCTDRQAEEIRAFNAVGNWSAHAHLIAYRTKEKVLCFGMPGDRWDERATLRWPIGAKAVGPWLTNWLNLQVGCFDIKYAALTSATESAS